MKPTRNADSVPGEWYIDTACINCGASRHVAPGLIVERNDKSVFLRQPVTPEEHVDAWRAVLVCPTASVRSETTQPRPGAAIFPQPITSAVWRCGFNARSSFGAHSYFARRPDGNLMIDSPRYAAELVKWFDENGGIAHILLSHRDDVADADKYARHFGARVWIHREDMSAAPYATDLLDDGSATDIAVGVSAIPVPGHTRGSVVYLLDDSVLFSGDSLAWSPRVGDLVAFRDACWYSWSELTESLGKLAAYRFDWLLPGHGWPTHLPADEMRARLLALVVRMRRD
ncbi:MBL fold metallo-hydrolase [Paraburkholderia youngii]|uniref:MBL fold metallo-hydrolase n=1 Tax=Paraburkholderia youngii TaxID=2782701 RepID=A0A7Y6K254_9BURK|nr:MBL fold metallo-hydrolase [Paraburkholderia youngii]NUY02474.1 MBL fold metallo-hydrolase [Paraburkholderia youngii]